MKKTQTSGRLDTRTAHALSVRSASGEGRRQPVEGRHEPPRRQQGRGGLERQVVAVPGHREDRGDDPARDGRLDEDRPGRRRLPRGALPTASRPGPGDAPDHARPPDQGAPVLCPIISPGRIESARAERTESPEALHGDRLELLRGSHQRIMGERDLLRTRRPHPVGDEQSHALPEIHPGDLPAVRD